MHRFARSGWVVGSAVVGGLLFGACSDKPEDPREIAPNTSTITSSATTGESTGTGGNGSMTSGQSGTPLITGGIEIPEEECGPQTCAEAGYACGKMLDGCDKVIDCAAEGLVCGPFEDCIAGVDDGLTRCEVGIDCSVCGGVPDCSAALQPTRLNGRVVTPGRADDNIANQVGVPNAIVYILRNTDPAELPAIASGVPDDGSGCDSCADEDLGPWLTGATTDATGRFTIEGNIPVGIEFLLVVKVGKFRRAIGFTLPETAACTTSELPVTLPDNPARLPRHMTDGLAVNIPRVAVSTGPIDAMECVLEKMGIAAAEFGNPGTDGSAAPRVHLYRGGPETVPSGAYLDVDTPHDEALYADPERLRSYDVVVADCEGVDWDAGFPQRDASGDYVREYVNSGGRLFASHLSFSWLNENGTVEYAEDDPIATGLGPAATWEDFGTPGGMDATGIGAVSVGRPQSSPRIDSFGSWLVSEGVVEGDATTGYTTFDITDPRSAATDLGTSVQEFVYRTDGNERSQQFSFDTPYAAPEDAVCGRVAYSGFHVAATGGGTEPFTDVVFPAHCTSELANSGNLTDQEKVLLYMLFDLAACVGDPPDIPNCTPRTCESAEVDCGLISDGCGDVVDCGPCEVP